MRSNALMELGNEMLHRWVDLLLVDGQTDRIDRTEHLILLM